MLSKIAKLVVDFIETLLSFMISLELFCSISLKSMKLRTAIAESKNSGIILKTINIKISFVFII